MLPRRFTTTYQPPLPLLDQLRSTARTRESDANSEISIDTSSESSRPATPPETSRENCAAGTLTKSPTAAKLASMPGVELDSLPKPTKRQSRYQQSIAENMVQLDRLRKMARLGYRTDKTFSFPFAFKVIKDQVDLAELINLFLAISGPKRYETLKKLQNIDIGHFIAHTINTFKQAFTQVVSGTKEQYREWLKLVTQETKEELAKTIPEIQEICATIRTLLAARIDALDAAIAPGDRAIQVINGMFFWHQWIMGINVHPDEASVNESLKSVALGLVPKDIHREKLEFELSRYENGLGQRSLEPEVTHELQGELKSYRRHVFVLLEGGPGLGKTFLGKTLLHVYDNGERSYTVPPSNAGLFRPKSNATAPGHSDKDPDHIWLLRPEQVMSELAQLRALGFTTFLLEEADKYFLPQFETDLNQFNQAGRAPQASPSVSTDFKYDAEPKTEFLRYPFGPFKLPIPFDTGLYIFTTNKNFSDVYRNNYPELFRRLQVVIPFKTATEKSLLSAYSVGLERALTLTKNQKLSEAIRKQFSPSKEETTGQGNENAKSVVGSGLREIIVEVGREKLGKPHVTPDQMGIVTETVIGKLVTQCDKAKTPPDEVEKLVDKQKETILGSIDKQWSYYSGALGRAPGPPKVPFSRPPMPGWQGGQVPWPPQHQEEMSPLGGAGSSSAFAEATRRERKPALEMCYDALIKHADSHEEPLRTSIMEYFREHDILDMLVDKFKQPEEGDVDEAEGRAIHDGGSEFSSDSTSVSSSDGPPSAIEPESAGRYFDRQILLDAVKVACEHYAKSAHGNGSVPDGQSLFDAIQAIFKSAEEFMDNPEKARSTVNARLKICQAKLPDHDTKYALEKLFIQHKVVKKILDWFVTLKLATPVSLEAATDAIHQYLLENHKAGTLPEGSLKKELNEIILKAFEPARKLNGENLYKKRVRPKWAFNFDNPLRPKAANREEGPPEVLTVGLQLEDRKDSRQTYRGMMQRVNEDSDPGSPGSR